MGHMIYSGACVFADRCENDVQCILTICNGGLIFTLNTNEKSRPINDCSADKIMIYIHQPYK